MCHFSLCSTTRLSEVKNPGNIIVDVTEILRNAQDDILMV